MGIFFGDKIYGIRVYDNSKIIMEKKYEIPITKEDTEIKNQLEIKFNEELLNKYKKID